MTRNKNSRKRHPSASARATRREKRRGATALGGLQAGQRSAALTPPLARSVHLLHLGALVAVLLEGRQLLDVVRLVVVLDGEAELDHAVDAAGEGGRLVEREAGGEQRGLEEQVHQVLDGLVPLVRRRLGLELLHEGAQGQ